MSFGHLLKRLCLLSGTLGIVWGLGLAWFVFKIPCLPPDQYIHTQAIVVLTGGANRIETGFTLFRKGMAQQLFISGVNTGVTLDSLLRHVDTPPLDKMNQIYLGYTAHNTTSNAWETAQWVRAHRVHSLRLVTSPYHMQRSLLEFSQLLPDTIIIPHPVFQAEPCHNQWWQNPSTLHLIIREYNKYCLVRLRMLLFR